MLLNTADIVAQTRLTAGGQRRFSLPGVTDLKKSPSLRGFFLSAIRPRRGESYA
jgi:hypothetical protein